jgi:hypothetical protein
MGYKNTHVVIVTADNPETGGEEQSVYGPFTSQRKAAEFRDKVNARIAKEAQVAYDKDGSYIRAQVWNLREPKILAAVNRLRDMIAEVG